MTESTETYVDYDCQGAVGDFIRTSTPEGEDYAVNFCGIEASGNSDETAVVTLVEPILFGGAFPP